MLKNVGNTDKLIRLVLGLLIIIIAGYYQSWWALLGVVLVITGLTRTCMIYRLIGVNTCKMDSKDKTDSQYISWLKKDSTHLYALESIPPNKL